MTFDEWKEQNLNRFTCSHEVFVAYEAWQQQQKRIDELEDYIQNTDSQKRINVLETLTENQQLTIADQVESEEEYLRQIEKLEWNLNNVKHALEEQKKLNSVLNGRLEALQAQLEVADIRPMEESEYLERIETLKDELEDKFRIICNLRSTIAGLTEKLDIERNRTEEQVEWHKRRAEGWRSIAVLEEKLK